MTRYFGIAGIQMAVEPWNATATVDKMRGVTIQVNLNFPWVNMLRLSRTRRARSRPVCCNRATRYLAPECRTNSRPTHRSFVRDRPMPRTGWCLAPCTKLDEDKIYNTASVISPEGKIVTKYRKMFPWLPFEAGTRLEIAFCVFDIPDVGRFGLCICYDTWFPETVRNLAWMGAEVIIHPTMTPTSDRTLELVLNQANAISTSATLSISMASDLGAGGRSMIVDPDGRVLQQAGEHETILTEILDLDNVRKAREFGSLGLCQLWKQLRDTPVDLPMYGGDLANGPIFRDLGDLRLTRSLRSYPDATGACC